MKILRYVLSFLRLYILRHYQYLNLHHLKIYGIYCLYMLHNY